VHLTPYRPLAAAPCVGGPPRVAIRVRVDGPGHQHRDVFAMVQHERAAGLNELVYPRRLNGRESGAPSWLTVAPPDPLDRYFATDEELAPLDHRAVSP
jgi:hypothetical protein